jgi:hypothetical protein
MKRLTRDFDGVLLFTGTLRKGEAVLEKRSCVENTQKRQREPQIA